VFPAFFDLVLEGTFLLGGSIYERRLLAHALNGRPHLRPCFFSEIRGYSSYVMTCCPPTKVTREFLPRPLGRPRPEKH